MFRYSLKTKLKKEKICECYHVSALSNNPDQFNLLNLQNNITKMFRGPLIL